jgi:dephospho-CoA kinase
MRKIGITGGIGSGKTTVCKVFETLGVPVFYADAAAKLVMTDDPELVQSIIDAFGVESYFSGGELNRKHIAGIVFNDSAALAGLNALVHPAVFRAFDQWISRLPAGTVYALKEAALLFESGSGKLCDENIVVVSPIELKLQRLIKRDQVSEEDIKARMDKQLSDEEKLQLADHIIDNDEAESIIAQVMRLHQKFSS